jgi:hypothetical protein
LKTIYPRVSNPLPSLLRTHLRLASSYKLTSNTFHSGVGYYAPAARTTINPCVFLSSSQRSSKTPKPLLISGFRAGALRHPAGDLLSDTIEAQFVFSALDILIDVIFFWGTILRHFVGDNFRKRL